MRNSILQYMKFLFNQRRRVQIKNHDGFSCGRVINLQKIVIQNKCLTHTVDNSVLLGLIGSDYAAYVAPTQAELDAELAAGLRAERDQKLAQEVDPTVTNPLRWAELTDAKQAEWTQYRTDLLNLPAQAGFPNTVTWPTKPS